MTYRFKGKFVSKEKYKQLSNLKNTKKYLSKTRPAKKPALKKPALKKLPARPAKLPALRVKEIERTTRESLRRDSEERQKEIKRKAEERRKRERTTKQGVIIRDLEETDPHGVKGSKPIRWSKQGSYNLRVTRIRKTYKPGYKKVHRGIERDTRYTKAVLVKIPFALGPGTSANEEMEVFMEKVLAQYSLPGDEEFYGTVETGKRKIARTIAKRQEIPMEFRRVRRRSKPR